MRLIPLLSTAALVLAGIGLSAQTSLQTGAPSGKLFSGSRQLLVVVTPDWNSVDGRLQRYERTRTGEAWQPVGDSVLIVVGKSGLGWGRGLTATPAADGGPVKREGDGRSPAGVFALGTAFGYAPEKLTGSKLPYLVLTPSTECVDDVASKSYNRIVDRSATAVDWTSSEQMRNTGESYRWGIVVGHNGIAATRSSPVTSASGGSCIFLHLWKGPGHGTAGCTAMAPSAIESLLTWLDPRQRPLLVQLTAEEYARLMKPWRLPTVINLTGR